MIARVFRNNLRLFYGESAMKRGELARNNFKEGYNCAQAVFLAFSDVTGLSDSAALKLSAPFGGGVGRMREICGTVSAMMMVCGLVFYDSGHVTLEEKSALYAREQELARRFRETNGTIVCRELLRGVTEDSSPNAEARTAEYYKKRPCADLCACAAEILEGYLIEQGMLPAAAAAEEEE